MAGATTCPECGKRVSAFAAGCVCGADLEAYARRARLAAVDPEPSGAGRTAALRLPRPALPRPDLSKLEAACLAATVFAVLFISALGMVCGLLGILYARFEDKRILLGVYVVLAVVGAGTEVAALLGQDASPLGEPVLPQRGTPA